MQLKFEIKRLWVRSPAKEVNERSELTVPSIKSKRSLILKGFGYGALPRKTFERSENGSPEKVNERSELTVPLTHKFHKIIFDSIIQ